VSLVRHLVATVGCPGLVTVAVPALIVWRTDAGIEPLGLVALPLIALGLLLIVRTIALFATFGGGTLAPWDPTTRLVVRGPYRRVRNPMISGVLFVLLGEAALFASPALLLWFALVWAVNAVYIPLVEEPGLQGRFGEEYVRYAAHVPRWIPRVRPWDAEEPTR
jgi:protein-S-isoprenylcysteine O-methyltransferase Ste14